MYVLKRYSIHICERLKSPNSNVDLPYDSSAEQLIILLVAYATVSTRLDFFSTLS